MISGGHDPNDPFIIAVKYFLYLTVVFMVGWIGYGVFLGFSHG